MTSLRRPLLLAAALALLAGCASDDAAPASTTAGGATTLATTTAPATTVVAASTSVSPPQTIGAGETAPPSPTGVPGIDNADEFCAAWARYGGTVQIVAVAVNFGELEPMAAARLELESAPTLVAAVEDIEASWPAEITDERAIAVDSYLGPYARRAAKAVEALGGAGVDDAGQTQLRDTWAQVLATRNPDEPTVAVDLPADLAAQVDAAATAFDAAVTPWGADPSLRANLDDIPKTKAYLAAHCADLASIGLGDDI